MSFKLASIAALFVFLLAASAQGDDAAELSRLIDSHIETRLDSAGIQPLPAADDAEFLRRAYLDLHGVVPSAEITIEFLDSRDAEKRARLIDELLASPRFGERFADIWSAYLLSPLAAEQREPTERFGDWLAQRFAENVAWDKIAFELITASGTLEENPAVAYLIEGRYPLGVTDLTDLSSRYFLGVQLNCAQCHDHPFVELKQRDYWGMAAFFTQIQTPGRPKAVYRAGIVDDPKITSATLEDADILEGFQAQPPTFLGGETFDPSEDETLRIALARWMTSSDNPYFARAMVNRMWQHFFGKGIVEPVDDMHAANVPSHPELLDSLSERFVRSGFDLKLLCKAIVNSRTYQRTSRPGENPDEEAQLFARMSGKTLAPEQLYDSLVAILGPPGKTPGIDTRLGARVEFCQYFAGSGDSDPTRYERGIPHALRLMNSPQFAGPNLEALVRKIEGSSRSADETVERLYLTVLSRRPTSDELQIVGAHVQDAGGGTLRAYQEAAWALLMSSEFMVNH
jgi:hypothetical protein